ncbi:MAG TPA: hypothetical protein V6C76_11895 [Drouetiella sp.]
MKNARLLLVSLLFAAIPAHAAGPAVVDQAAKQLDQEKVVAAMPAHASNTPVPAPEVMVFVAGAWRPVLGQSDERHEKLVHILPKALAHRTVHIYKVEGTTVPYETYDKLSMVPELRDPEVAHPVRTAVTRNAGWVCSMFGNAMKR